MSYQIRIEGLDKLQRNFKQAPAILDRHLRPAITDSVREVEHDVKGYAPRRSGRFVGSIGGKVTGRGAMLTGTVGTKSPLRGILESGAKPHEIVPRGTATFKRGSRKGQARGGSKVLYLGDGIFTRRVRHPGMRGFHMFKRGFEGNVGKIKQRFVQALERVAKDLAQ